jgi:hypothetical protein
MQFFQWKLLKSYKWRKEKLDVSLMVKAVKSGYLIGNLERWLKVLVLKLK